ncbi:MAG: copper homeostasis protein CutC [Bacteroidaceae bacterium]|nr:copper homeostasis protein CutC [Bacteroidaceae bacterium]
MFEFEVCANGLASVIQAERGGATRVELCAGIPEGGTTPSFGTIVSASNYLKDKQMKLHVIIRPRSGDFLCPTLVFTPMLEDIKAIKEHIEGVVFGCLNKDGSIDVDSCRLLIEAAQGKSLTFHRAFDMCADPLRAIDQLAELGFHRILTSGGRATAEEGIPQLKLWQRHAEGKIQLMAGGGVNETNIKRIYEETGITAYHFTARETFISEMEYRNPDVYMGVEDADEYSYEITTERRVRRIISQLQ